MSLGHAIILELTVDLYKTCIRSIGLVHMHVNVYNVNSNLFLRPRKELRNRAGRLTGLM